MIFIGSLPLYFNSRPSARGDVSFLFQLCILPISIHAPPRGATAKGNFPACCNHFNSRPSARGDSSTGMSCRPAHNFNSRPSARGDFPPFCRPSLINYFNSRPSARGDPAFLVVRLLLRHHFNSRPSARGDMEAAELAKMSQYISIHAPPRGATARTSALQARNAPRGATLDMGTFTNAVLISIHAPPRGATVNARHVADGVVISIHAPPRGATIKLPFQKFQRGLFQFTPLREGRQSS